LELSHLLVDVWNGDIFSNKNCKDGQFFWNQKEGIGTLKMHCTSLNMFSISSSGSAKSSYILPDEFQTANLP